MTQNRWPATLNSLASIQAFIETTAAQAGLDTSNSPSISLIVEEIIVNIISHAYKDTDTGIITIGLEPTKEALSISFSDTGPPFNPLKADPPDITKAIDEREIGGLGLFMVMQMADEIKYSRHDNQNILTVTIHMAKDI